MDRTVLSEVGQSGCEAQVENEADVSEKQHGERRVLAFRVSVDHVGFGSVRLVVDRNVRLIDQTLFQIVPFQHFPSSDVAFQYFSLLFPYVPFPEL